MAPLLNIEVILSWERDVSYALANCSVTGIRSDCQAIAQNWITEIPCVDENEVDENYHKANLRYAGWFE